MKEPNALFCKSCQFNSIEIINVEKFLIPTEFWCGYSIVRDKGDKRMIKRCFLHSGNDPKSGKLSAGMGGRFHSESVAGLDRNGWQVCARICMNRLLSGKDCMVSAYT